MDRVLLVVRYAGDIERKRLEYLLKRYTGRVRSERVHGTAFFLEGDSGELEKFLRELYARIPPERVEAYRVERFRVEIAPERVTGRLETSLDGPAVWGVVEFLVKKMKGVLVSDAGGARRYRLYTKGGVVDVLFSAHPRRGGGTVLTFTVEGYDEHVESVYRELERELRYLAG